MHGGVARFINHGCEPNCVVVAVRVLSPVPHLAVFASKAIAAGEELTLNYGASRDDDVPLSTTRCLCGAGSCRGFLPALVV